MQGECFLENILCDWTLHIYLVVVFCSGLCLVQKEISSKRDEIYSYSTNVYRLLLGIMLV